MRNLRDYFSGKESRLEKDLIQCELINTTPLQRFMNSK